MAWQPPTPGSRPVAVLGGGVLGRRIACVFVSGRYNVNIYDLSPKTLQEAADFVQAEKADFAARLGGSTSGNFGTCTVFDDLPSAAANTWLVVEAIPEKLELKVDVFGKLDALCPADCIFGSNSSSYRSSMMAGKLSEERRKLLCNIHFTMPPDIRTVELMTAGQTYPEVFPFVTEVLEGCGMLVVTAVKESTGFIFNRLWAAVKREILQILAEGVSGPEQIDLLWETMFKAEVTPCKLMDQIGLDTVAFIEDNYIKERNLDGSQTVDWLRENYISQGKLGKKSDKGGLLPKPSSISPPTTNGCNGTPATNGVKSAKEIYVLDVGIGANLESVGDIATNGKIMRIDPSTKQADTIVAGLPMPDGLDVSKDTGRMFWTNMGSSTSIHDGSVMSSNLDGTDVQTIVPAGKLHTPKQLIVADKSRKIYLCDREGTSVHRFDFNGANHEVLVRYHPETTDMTQWCVGIAVDEAAGKIYWTQKGPSKASRGRIFRANINIPSGQSAESRMDIELLFENLPEPIDLEIDHEAQALYWTDRGEHPFGSSLNRVSLAACTGVNAVKPETLARHFHEPIGLKLDLPGGRVYVTDLGGSVYAVDMDTKRKDVIYTSDAAYTGITLV